MSGAGLVGRTLRGIAGAGLGAGAAHYATPDDDPPPPPTLSQRGAAKARELGQKGAKKAKEMAMHEPKNQPEFLKGKSLIKKSKKEAGFSSEVQKYKRLAGAEMKQRYPQIPQPKQASAESLVADFWEKNAGGWFGGDDDGGHTASVEFGPYTIHGKYEHVKAWRDRQEEMQSPKSIDLLNKRMAEHAQKVHGGDSSNLSADDHGKMMDHALDHPHFRALNAKHKGHDKVHIRDEHGETGGEFMYSPPAGKKASAEDLVAEYWEKNAKVFHPHKTFSDGGSLLPSLLAAGVATGGAALAAKGLSSRNKARPQQEHEEKKLLHVMTSRTGPQNATPVGGHTGQS